MGFTAATWAIISAITTAISVTYQVSQAKKAKRKAEAAKEARRGFEGVLESEVISIPIVYGRAKIGGILAWAQTTSTLNNMISSISGVDFINTGYSGTQTGSKNEYLVMQQALCVGPINKVYDFIIDDSLFYNDTQFLHIHSECHTNGGLNPNISSNFSERNSAVFSGLAYTNTFVKIDRDNPQEMPRLSFFIEGRKVRTITRSGSVNNYSYTLNSTREYTNNPAYCLLDYLLEDATPYVNLTNKALSLNEIDLESFYNAALVCNRIVQTNRLVGGKIWQPTNNSRNITTRNIPLYECNIIVDTSKPIRENIENILSTMGDARLIWSNGKYKLSLQYPGAPQ